MRVAVVVAGLLLLAACVKTTVDTYRSVPDSRADSAYVKPGVDFTRYTRLQAVPLEIYFDDSMGAPDPTDLARIRQIFREAFLGKIGDDYEIVDAPGPDVLHVRGSLVDLELTSVPDDLPVKGRAASLIASGHLSFFMELADSESGEVLARAGDQDQEEAAPRIAGSDAARDWSQTEQAAERWAQMFRDFLDDNLGR